MAGHDKYGIHSKVGGKTGAAGKAVMAGHDKYGIHSKGGKVGSLQADPAKQLPGGNKCNPSGAAERAE